MFYLYGLRDMLKVKKQHDNKKHLLSNKIMTHLTIIVNLFF